jgi:hypothetical protein
LRVVNLLPEAERAPYWQAYLASLPGRTDLRGHHLGLTLAHLPREERERLLAEPSTFETIGTLQGVDRVEVALHILPLLSSVDVEATVVAARRIAGKSACSLCRANLVAVAAVFDPSADFVSALLASRRMAPADVRWRALSTLLQRRLEGVQVSEAVSAWKAFLEASERSPRPQVLGDLCRLVPLIVKAGGEGLVRSCADAVQAVRVWWP